MLKLSIYCLNFADCETYSVKTLCGHKQVCCKVRSLLPLGVQCYRGWKSHIFYGIFIFPPWNVVLERLWCFQM